MKFRGDPNVNELTPTAFKAKLQCRVDLMQVFIDGLNGKPFRWEYEVFNANKPLMRELGITLVTPNHIKRLGYSLRQRSNAPVGEVYFKQFSRWADVYILECQCILADKPTAGKSK